MRCNDVIPSTNTTAHGTTSHSTSQHHTAWSWTHVPGCRENRTSCLALLLRPIRTPLPLPHSTYSSIMARDVELSRPADGMGPSCLPACLPAPWKCKCRRNRTGNQCTGRCALTSYAHSTSIRLQSRVANCVACTPRSIGDGGANACYVLLIRRRGREDPTVRVSAYSKVTTPLAVCRLDDAPVCEKFLVVECG